MAEIQRRYRRAVDEFQPDYVAITDTWNMKPLLAEAMRGFPVLLLFQAQECLCPLNNLRLLGVGPTQVEQCPRNQLATPQVCHGCLAQRGHHSGALHQVERALAGVGSAEYDQKMRRSLLEAEAVLALNPVTATCWNRLRAGCVLFRGGLMRGGFRGRPRRRTGDLRSGPRAATLRVPGDPRPTMRTPFRGLRRVSRAERKATLAVHGGRGRRDDQGLPRCP